MVSEMPAQGGGNSLSQASLHRRPVSTVIVAYIAVQSNPLFVHHAQQFVETYQQFNPGSKHRLLVICNGGPLVPKMKEHFYGLPCEFFDRTNDGGWDVSAYQDVAKTRECDLLVCFGESVRFHRSGWLERLVDCANEFGEGMYGCLSSFAISPHLNTTAFAVTPRYLNEYPAVRNKAARYNFEHGAGAMWRRIRASGGATRLVTWDGCWEPHEWRKPENILWRGTQGNLLVRCNHTDNFVGRHEHTRRSWANLADGITE